MRNQKFHAFVHAALEHFPDSVIEKKYGKFVFNLDFPFTPLLDVENFEKFIGWFGVNEHTSQSLFMISSNAFQYEWSAVKIYVPNTSFEINCKYASIPFEKLKKDLMEFELIKVRMFIGGIEKIPQIDDCEREEALLFLETVFPKKRNQVEQFY